MHPRGDGNCNRDLDGISAGCARVSGPMKDKFIWFSFLRRCLFGLFVQMSTFVNNRALRTSYCLDTLTSKISLLVLPVLGLVPDDGQVFVNVTVLANGSSQICHSTLRCEVDDTLLCTELVLGQDWYSLSEFAMASSLVTFDNTVLKFPVPQL